MHDAAFFMKVMCMSNQKTCPKVENVGSVKEGGSMDAKRTRTQTDIHRTTDRQTNRQTYRQTLNDVKETQVEKKVNVHSHGGNSGRVQIVKLIESV